MKLYEITYLTPSELSQEEVNSFQEKIISYITENKGILLDIKKPLRKLLACPIKKRREALLTSLDFQLPTSSLKDLEKKLKQEPDILRYIILSKKEKKVLKETRVKKEPKTAPQKPQKKTELKEIDEKLKEILAENNK